MIEPSEEGLRYFEAAKKWVGTPFRHHQSCRGHGSDCVGLCLGAGRDAGLLPPDFKIPNYSVQWHMHKNEELLIAGLEALGFFEIREPVVGCVIAFKFGRVCSHVGVYDGHGGFVHAYFSMQRAVFQPLVGDLAQRARHFYAGPWERDRLTSLQVVREVSTL